MIVLGNDDSKKMEERESLRPFCEEYAYVTNIELTLVEAGERPDFTCEKRGLRLGLEVVRAMRDPLQRTWQIRLGGDGLVHGLEATDLIQETVYQKERKRSQAGWLHRDSTILVIQLIGSDAEEVSEHLDDELMDEMSRTGFVEIWVADHSPMEPYGTVQLFGIKPKQWRGLHDHRYSDRKPYG